MTEGLRYLSLAKRFEVKRARAKEDKTYINFRSDGKKTIITKI